MKKLWLDQINRANFIPTDNTVVCERHFEDSKFQPSAERSRGRKRVRRQLRPRAYPTLFLRPCDEEEPITSGASSISTAPPKALGDHSYSRGGNLSDVRETPLDTMIPNEVTISESDGATHEESEQLKNPPEKISLCEKRSCVDQQSLNDALLQRIRFLENQLEEEKKQKELYQTALKDICNEDQVEKMLLPSSSTMHWSVKTIMDSIYLYYKLGHTNYEFLRKQRKMPLPCKATLLRHLSAVDCNTGILRDFIEFMKKPVENLKPHEKFCIACVDEMSLKVSL